MKLERLRKQQVNVLNEIISLAFKLAVVQVEKEMTYKQAQERVMIQGRFTVAWLRNISIRLV